MINGIRAVTKEPNGYSIKANLPVVAHLLHIRPGGIGYVSKSARLDGVKELTIAN